MWPNLWLSDIDLTDMVRSVAKFYNFASKKVADMDVTEFVCGRYWFDQYGLTSAEYYICSSKIICVQYGCGWICRKLFLYATIPDWIQSILCLEFDRNMG